MAGSYGNRAYPVPKIAFASIGVQRSIGPHKSILYVVFYIIGPHMPLYNPAHKVLVPHHQDFKCIDIALKDVLYDFSVAFREGCIVHDPEISCFMRSRYHIRKKDHRETNIATRILHHVISGP